MSAPQPGEPSAHLPGPVPSSGGSPIRLRSASLKLTENCQARCVTCDYWRTVHTDRLTGDDAVALIDELAAMGVRVLRLTGGEPLLRRDLFDILARADTAAFEEITLQTNALMLASRASQVDASPITHVAVSLDGVDADNDAIRGVPGYYRRALAGLARLHGKTVIIATTLTGVSARRLDELIDVAQAHGGYLAVNLPDDRLYFLGSADLGRLWPSSEEAEAIVEVLGRRLPHQFSPAELDFVRAYLLDRGAGTRLNPPCMLGLSVLYVGSDGAVRPGCYALPPLGNVLDHGVRQIVASPRYRERVASMIRLECPGCACNVFESLRWERADVARALEGLG